MPNPFKTSYAQGVEAGLAGTSSARNPFFGITPHQEEWYRGHAHGSADRLAAEASERGTLTPDDRDVQTWANDLAARTLAQSIEQDRTK